MTSAEPAAQPITIIEFMSGWARDNGVILRSRIPAEKKVLAAIMCASGYTYRDTSKILGGISHVAVHDAHKTLMAALPPLQKKRREVTIEENVVDLNAETKAVIWLARDEDSGEILVLPLLDDKVSHGPEEVHRLRSLGVHRKAPPQGGKGFELSEFSEAAGPIFPDSADGHPHQEEDNELLPRRF